MIEEIKKHNKGHFIRKTLDDTDAPKMSFYLSMNGTWIRKLDNTCLFPTEKLAKTFLALRNKKEEVKLIPITYSQREVKRLLVSMDQER